MERIKNQGMHKDRVFDNQELPASVAIDLVDNLDEIGGPINGVSKDKIRPNTVIKTPNGDSYPAVWYPHSSISKVERQGWNYEGLDKLGKPLNRFILPSGWVLTENCWTPLVFRLMRVMNFAEIEKNPEILDRVRYSRAGKEVNFDSKKMSGDILTSLGAAGNEFIVNYTHTFGKWLVMDTKSIGYKTCGIGKRIYGTGCYFGGFWTCADRSSAKGVDDTVCKNKIPPWPAKYFLATIDDIVYNAGEGSSIKSGRIKILNIDRDQKIPS